MTVEIPPKSAEIIGRLYPPSGAHGKDHATQTVADALKISNEPEYIGKISNRDRELIAIAAAGHDIGYSGKEEYWSGTQWEHPYASLQIVDNLLKGDDSISDQERALINMLVLNHDNTQYTFPALRRFEVTREAIMDYVGIPNLRPEVNSETTDVDKIITNVPARKFESMLHILQEADALLGDARRTIDFSRSRNIPVLYSDGEHSGIGIPMWQLSGAANVMLAAKRALIDSYTLTGIKKAWRMFTDSRDYIKSLIKETSGVGVDDVGELLRLQDVYRFVWGRRRSQALGIRAAYPLESVNFITRTSVEQKFKSRLINIRDIQIDGHKVNSKIVRRLESLREQVLTNYAIDILTEIPGALRLFAEEGMVPFEEIIMPPIYVDNKGTFSRQYHSQELLYLARELGLPQLRILVI